jgi:hypothetical protein
VPVGGDIVYDLQNAVVDPYHVGLDREPQTTGNHVLTKRQEKAAIKKTRRRRRSRR